MCYYLVILLPPLHSHFVPRLTHFLRAPMERCEQLIEGEEQRFCDGHTRRQTDTQRGGRSSEPDSERKRGSEENWERQQNVSGLV